MEYRLNDYPMLVLKKLDRLRTQQILTDIMVGPNNRGFPYHLLMMATCSPLFSNPATAESSLKDFSELSPGVMEKIISFVYSGSIAIGKDDIDHLHKAAQAFKITLLDELCEKFKGTQQNSGIVRLDNIKSHTAESFDDNGTEIDVACVCGDDDDDDDDDDNVGILGTQSPNTTLTAEELANIITNSFSKHDVKQEVFEDSSSSVTIDRVTEDAESLLRDNTDVPADLSGWPITKVKVEPVTKVKVEPDSQEVNDRDQDNEEETEKVVSQGTHNVVMGALIKDEEEFSDTSFEHWVSTGAESDGVDEETVNQVDIGARVPEDGEREDHDITGLEQSLRTEQVGGEGVSWNGDDADQEMHASTDNISETSVSTLIVESASEQAKSDTVVVPVHLKEAEPHLESGTNIEAFSKNALHMCTICHEDFASPRNLRWHKRDVHEKTVPQTLHCDSCSKQFQNLSNLQRHKLESHEGFGLLRSEREKLEKCKCDICDKVFSSVLHMKYHQRRTHFQCGKAATAGRALRELKKWRCLECRKEFKSLALLRKHKDSHHQKFSAAGSLQSSSEREKLEKYRCPTCGREFASHRSLTLHCKIAHEKRNTVHCDVCGKECLNQVYMYRHKVESHDGVGLLKRERELLEKCRCPICGKIFASIASMRVHKTGTHRRRDIARSGKLHSKNDSGKTWSCLECEEPFPSLSLVHEHQGKIHSKVLYNCEKCGKGFRMKHTLTLHFEKHHNTNHRTCKKCNIVFGTRRKLKHHNLAVHKDDVLTCDICNKRLASAYCLRWHKRRVHETVGGLPMACDLCGQECRNFRDLQKHKLLSHDGVGLSKSERERLEKCRCPVCGKIFSATHSVQIHMKGTHVRRDAARTATKRSEKDVSKNDSGKDQGEEKKEGKTWSCLECKEPFTSLSLVHEHQDKIHTKVLYNCEKCGKGFRMKHTLTLHMGKHKLPRTCEKCYIEFVSQRKLTQHNIAVHNNDGRTCDICNKKFASAYRLREHRNAVHEKVGKHAMLCELCGRECRNLKGLQKHKLISHEGAGLSNGEREELERCRCPICGKIFSAVRSMRLHKKETHIRREAARTATKQSEKDVSKNDSSKDQEEEKNEGKTWSCLECKEPFTSLSLVHEHQDRIHTKVMYNCEKCGAGFRMKNSLAIHLRKHHTYNKPSKTCKKCNIVFGTRRKLEQHNLAVHKDDGQTCDICNKRLASTRCLRQHKRIVHENAGDRAMLCDLCGKQCYNLRDMQRHRLISHEGAGLSNSEREELEKRRCPICGKIFTTVQSVQIHMKGTHIRREAARTATKGSEKDVSKNDSSKDQEEEKPAGKTWSCLECKEPFPSLSLVYEHQEKTHTKVLYNCEKCGKGFCMKHSLTLHIGKHHSDNKPSSTCEQCNIVLGSRQKLRKHNLAVHKDDGRTCDICNKKLASPCWLREHKKVVHEKVDDRAMLCELCGKECQNSKEMQKHKLMSHEGAGLSNSERDELEKCRCPICGKIFAAVRSMRLHKKETHIRREAARTATKGSEKGAPSDDSGNRPRKSRTKAKKWLCKECKRPFTSLALLREHQEIHNKYDGYRCEHCGKGFGMKQTLMRHVKAHEKKAAQTCRLCNILFATRKNLKEHKISVHDCDDKTCEICHKKFSRRRLLESHKNEIHEKSDEQTVQE